MSSAAPPAQLVVLYDDDCGFCKWSLNAVLRWDGRRRRLRPVAIQGEEGRELLAAIPPERRLDSWHLALPGGRVLSAGAAAAPLARSLPGGRPLGWLFEAFPGATDRAYRFVASRRGRLGRMVGADAGYEVRR